MSDDVQVTRIAGVDAIPEDTVRRQIDGIMVRSNQIDHRLDEVLQVLETMADRVCGNVPQTGARPDRGTEAVTGTIQILQDQTSWRDGLVERLSHAVGRMDDMI